MKLIGILSLSFLIFGFNFNGRALDDVVSIYQLSDGTFDVLCKDHSREVVSKEDLTNENVCPHVPAPPTQPQIDLLIVIDNSGSMIDSQEKLADLAGDIIANLRNKTSNFQIAITTTEAYKDQFISNTNYSRFRPFQGRHILKASDSDLESGLRALILQGIDGSGDERPFMSMETALNNPLNHKFYRGGDLQVLFLTDEDDYSHPLKDPIGDLNDPALDNPQFYDTYLFDLTQSTDDQLNFKVHAIAIFDKACQNEMSSTGFAYPIANRIHVLVDQSGGEAISICDPVAPMFSSPLKF